MLQLLSQTWSNLVANKLRSVLTMFGIVWGVTSIVILSAVGEGFQRGNQSVLREFGKNIVILFRGRTSMQAGGQRAGRDIRLTIEDVRALKERSRLLEFVTPELQRGNVSAKSPFNASSVGVSGVWPIYQNIRTIELEKGRLMNDADDREARRVVILGFDAYKQLFADRNAIGSQITLNGVPYTVIGKIRKKEQDSSYTGPDNGRLFVPYEAMRKDFPDQGSLNTADNIDDIIATPYQKVADDLGKLLDRQGRIDPERGGPVEAEIRSILAPLHNADPQDAEAVPIWNTALETVMFSKIMGSMGEFFLVVSVITLALGGIGVMNIMLISVKERTKEVGVRKALGATSSNILWQFFSEGLFLTLLSGLIGLGIGAGLCLLVNLLPMPSRFSGMILTWQTAAMAIGALVLVGVLASTYPARRAAELPPIEALRYEM